MPRWPSRHELDLQQLQDAAERKATAKAALADADAELERLVVGAVQAGTPAVHVADAAGIGRATLYRWLGGKVKP